MADTKTTGEITRSPIDGSELVRLATPGANWKATLSDIFKILGRELLTADRSYYVDNVGGSDSNPGSVGAPFATLQYAWEFLSATLDLGQWNLTINLAASVTPYLLAAENGWIGGTTVKILGAGSSTTTIQDLSFGNVSSFILGPSINVDKVTLTEVANAYNLFHGAIGTVDVSSHGGDVVLGTTVNSFSGFTVYNPGALLTLYDIVYSASNGQAIAVGYTGQLIIRGGTTHTVVGNPNFSIAFATSVDDGSLIMNIASITGTATGKRFDVTGNAIIDVFFGSGNLTAFPGNAAGTKSNGGQYVGAFLDSAQSITASGASLTVDYSLGSYAVISLGANVTTFAVSNWLAIGESRLTLEIDNTGAFGITFPTGWLAVGGTAPTITSGAGKRDIIVLTTSDAGTTVFIHTVGQNYSAIP